LVNCDKAENVSAICFRMVIKMKTKFLETIRINVRNRLLAGLFLLMPFGIALFVIIWLFRWVTGLLQPAVSGILAALIRSQLVEAIPPLYINVSVWIITVIIFLLLLYLLGMIGQFVMGKKVIAFGERLMLRIPLARTIYTATKQVIKTLSIPDSKSIKSVVIVEFPRPGFKAIGFLTGRIKTSDGKEFCKVLIPTTPNPTTGFFELVPSEEVAETNLTIEEAFKMIISGGIVSPDVLLSNKLGANKQESG